jgi:hypothetical protein
MKEASYSKEKIAMKDSSQPDRQKPTTLHLNPRKWRMAM